jgi:UDP-2-acetamido-3-amino-2,3-dideoxy-glucuronate N-acetyltransferase
MTQFHKTSEVQEGARVGKGTRIWQHSQVLKEAVIGEDCVIGHNCFIGSGARLGKGVKLQSNIDVWDRVTLEDYVFVGPSVVFTNDRNPRAKYPKSKYPEYGKWVPTLVKEEATIGANATIVCGITIGRCSFVGAGAVVTKDVSDYAIVVGNPAKQVGWVCECGNRIEFKGEEAECKVCRKKYKKENDKVFRV